MTDYLARHYYNGDASNRDFAVPFPYLSALHLKAYVGGIAALYTFNSATSIKLITAPPAGTDNVLIQRETPTDAMLHTIQTGTIAPADINVDDLQLLYIEQELQDAMMNALRAPFGESQDMTLVGGKTAFGGKVIYIDAVTGKPTPSNKTLAQLEATASSATTLVTVATMAGLRAITVTNAALIGTIMMTGFYSPNDGGQGVWTWVASSAIADDIGTTVNPTGNAGNGRWARLYDGALHDLWFGVKADASTDNSTALQLLEDRAYILRKPIYFPTQLQSRKFATRLFTYPGVLHFGDGMNVDYYGGGSLDSGPSTLVYTGLTVGFLYQTAIGGAVTAAPCWRDMNIYCTNGTSGTAIKLNDPANGFTDDITSQGAIVGCQIDRVGFSIAGLGGSAAINFSKVFNSRISGCFKVGGDYGLARLYGSDNIEVFQNNCYGASTNELISTTQGTFGNMLWVRDNVFTGMSPGAAGHLRIGSRSAYLSGNWFENSQVSGYNIYLTGGISVSLTDNGMFDNTVTNWLKVDGAYANLAIRGNNAGIQTSALFNSGDGYLAYWNALQPTHIDAANNFYNGGIPFINTALQVFPDTEGPLIAGNTIWRFSPNCAALTSNGGAYYTSVMVKGGFYAQPYAAAGANRLNFQPQASNRSVTDTVDVYVYAYGSVASQTLTVIEAGGGTQALTTTPAWYKIISNTAVTALTGLTIDNVDSVRAGICYVGQILLVKH